MSRMVSVTGLQSIQWTEFSFLKRVICLVMFLKKEFLFLFSCLFLSTSLLSQPVVEKVVDIPAAPVGGKADVDFVFQSQVIYPAELLKKNTNRDVAIYFTVSADGTMKDVEFKQPVEPEFEAEAKRLLSFFLFTPAKVGNVKVASQSFLLFKFNTDDYRKFIKKRGFTIPKDLKNMDTSFVIYDKADVSPEYIKGEQALSEFILENLEYPDLAVKQNLQGTVQLSFIVEPNGRISNVVAEKEFNHLCTQEAMRMMRETKWLPGKLNGKSIRYRTKYPIVFNLNNHNKDNAVSEQR